MEKEKDSFSSEIIPPQPCLIIVQPDVQRCQKSREADPVLMNGWQMGETASRATAKNWGGTVAKRVPGKEKMPNEDKEWWREWMFCSLE